MATLIFGRVPERERGRGDRLDIVLPEVVLFGMFWNASRPIEETIDKQLAQMRKKSIARPVPPTTSRRGTLYANNVHLSTAGGDSCLDFYYLSPRDLHFARTQGSDISLHAIIRVTLSPVLVKCILDACRPYAEALTANEGKKEKIHRASVS